MRVQARSQKFAMWGAVLGVWGRSSLRLKIFHFLAKITYFRGILINNNAFKTWHRNWQRNMIQLIALMGYV